MDVIQNEETVWKKNTFRNEETDISHNENNTPENNMEKKMKSIQKRKRYKENYKNIEEIQNIYDVQKKQKIPETNAADTQPELKESYIGCSAKKIDEPEKQPTEEKLSEGFKNIHSFSDFLDNISQLLEWFIFIDTYLPKMLDEQLKKASVYLSSYGRINKNKLPKYKENNKSFLFLTNDKIIEHDSKIIKYILSVLFYFPFIVFAIYNWTFLVVYRDNKYCVNGENENEKCYPANTYNRIGGEQGIQFGTDDSELIQLLDFLFGFMISPLNVLDQLLFENTPNFKYLYKGIMDINNPLLNKMTMFVGLPYILYDMLNSIFSSNSNDNEGDPFYAIMLLSFVLFFIGITVSIITYFFPFLYWVFSISGFCGSIILLHFFFKIIYYSFQFGNFVMSNKIVFANPVWWFIIATYVVAFITFLILLACLSFVSSKVSMILVIIYLLFHSLVGIIWYGGGFYKLLGNLKKIYGLSVEKQTKCETEKNKELTLAQKLFFIFCNKINSIRENFFTYILIFHLLYLCFFSIVQLKGGVIQIFIILVLLILYFLLFKITSYISIGSYININKSATLDEFYDKTREQTGAANIVEPNSTEKNNVSNESLVEPTNHTMSSLYNKLPVKQDDSQSKITTNIQNPLLNK